MPASDFWSSITFADLMPLFGALALLVGGGALIASGIPKRAEIRAQRVNLALPQNSAARPNAAQEAPVQRWMKELPPLPAGLSAAQQRLVVRLFSRWRAPANLALLYFILVRSATALGLGALTLIGARGLDFFASSSALWMASGIGGAIVGWILPAVLIAYEVKQRAKAVALGLPEALELLVICVEAGLSLEDGLHRVSQELEESQSALADELALTWAEINILPSRSQALDNLAKRVDDPGVRAIVGMLSQSLQLGTPLAQSLRTGAIEMRNDQMTLMEERASRLPALLTIPVMLFIMPTIFLIVGGPAALRMIDSFHGGSP
jgi:tight adherence protein C